MGKRINPPSEDSGHIKYTLLKSTLQELWSDSGQFQGIVFKVLPSPEVQVFVYRFMLNSTLESLSLSSSVKKATTINGLTPAKVKGFDLAFLNKTELHWLITEMGPNDKLCIADAYIDMGKTPPFLNKANNKKYLTFKVWIESPRRATTGNRSVPTDTYPGFTVLLPCPPIWPPYGDIPEIRVGTSGG